MELVIANDDGNFVHIYNMITKQKNVFKKCGLIVLGPYEIETFSL